MNFKLNALVVATLLAASGVAQAKTADSNDYGTTFGGDLFASLVSTSNTTSYMVDLGITLDQFIGAVAPTATGIKLVWDLDANTFSDGVGAGYSSTGLVSQTLNYGSVYTTFASPAVIGASDLKFDIKALDGLPSSGIVPVGANRYLSTSAATSITSNNGQVTNMDVPGDNYLTASNADTTNSTHGTAFNTAGANMYNAGDATNVYFQNSMGDNFAGQAGFNSTGSASNNLNFFFLANSSANSAHAATITKYSGVWSFDSTTAQLSYATAPVPEAETYAMMLAGLGLVGFMVSRRRKMI